MQIRILSATARRGAILSALSLFLLFAGCASSGPPIRSFLLPEGRQYFVRPVEMKGENGELLLDLTVRLIDEADGQERSAGANFSAPFSRGTRDVEDAFFQIGDGERLPLEQLRFLYVGEQFVRYESSMSYEDATALAEAAGMEDALVQLFLRRNGNLESYRGTKEFYEAMRQLHLRLE